MRGLNLKEIMSKSNMNQQGLNIATYGQAYLGRKNKILAKKKSVHKHGFRPHVSDESRIRIRNFLNLLSRWKF